MGLTNVIFMRQEIRPLWRRFGKPKYGPVPDQITTTEESGFHVGMKVEYLGRTFVITHIRPEYIP